MVQQQLFSVKMGCCGSHPERQHPVALGYLHENRAFRDGRRVRAECGGILLDPLLRHPHARFGSGLVLADSHRQATVSGADECITYKALYRTHGSLDIGFTFLQQAE